ncbi:MAG: four helix bundle protein [Myxococcales bacterium]|nr:MAG: four helix bundle protein [Myxococcales bacterium]
MDEPLPHERLDVYRCSIEWTSLSHQFLQRLSRGDSELRDQLRRASLSIPLNIAEGTGKGDVPDRVRFHRIARGSALECAALADVLAIQGVISAEEHARAKELLRRISAMLTAMCR